MLRSEFLKSLLAIPPLAFFGTRGRPADGEYIDIAVSPGVRTLDEMRAVPTSRYRLKSAEHGDPLIGWWDYGDGRRESLVLADGEDLTFTLRVPDHKGFVVE